MSPKLLKIHTTHFHELHENFIQVICIRKVFRWNAAVKNLRRPFFTGEIGRRERPFFSQGKNEKSDKHIWYLNVFVNPLLVSWRKPRVFFENYSRVLEISATILGVKEL